MKKPSVLLVCADPGWRQALRNIFASSHLEMAECPDRGMAALCCDRIDPAIVVFASPSRHETGKDIGTAAGVRRDGCHGPRFLWVRGAADRSPVGRFRRGWAVPYRSPQTRTQC